MREPVIKRKRSYDLSVPVDKEKIMRESTSSCFGKAWDMSTKECPMCADRDICGIIYGDVNVVRAKEVQKKLKKTFLDESVLENITEDWMLSWVESGKTTSKELMISAMEVAQCDDVISVKRVVKDVLTSSDSLKIKDKIVWIA